MNKNNPLSNETTFVIIHNSFVGKIKRIFFHESNFIIRPILFSYIDLDNHETSHPYLSCGCCSCQACEYSKNLEDSRFLFEVISNAI